MISHNFYNTCANYGLIKLNKFISQFLGELSETLSHPSDKFNVTCNFLKIDTQKNSFRELPQYARCNEEKWHWIV